MNPDPFKLRELLLMAEGRGKFDWGRTSCLRALIATIMRDPKKSKGVKPSDFNPYSQKNKPVIKVPVSVLRDVWCKGKDETDHSAQKSTHIVQNKEELCRVHETK